MELVTLRDDLAFSRIIHGMWRLEEWKMSKEEIVSFVESCMEMGITTFDHADIYGNYTCESIFGEALATKSSLRESMEIVTKCGIQIATDKRPNHRLPHYESSKKHIIQSVENSLKNLHTDYIDTLLIHRPDPLMDPSEVAEAFQQLKKDGKVRHFGVSNFTPSQFNLLNAYVDEPLVTNQVELSVLHTESFHDGTLDLLLEKDVKPMAWSPLGGGRLFTEQSEKAIRVRNMLQEVATKHSTDIDTVAYAWLLRHPTQIMPIVGSGKIERVQVAVKALDINIERQEWYEIWRAINNKDID